MRVAYRDVTDESPLPEAHLIHYFMDGEYILSVMGDVFAIQKIEPEWPNE